ncbi:MAG: YcxB family protein, partial [Clostridiales bacterium]|nr:YcxB family protein [Clostridiales bacterium]
MEQTMEAAVSYRLDNREQKEFNQWFSRSFLKRKKVHTARPDVSNLQEDTKIRMEPGCIHIWSGQKELRLLYSALTELEETGTLIIFFAQKEFWAIPKRVFGGEDGAGRWFGQLKAACGQGISDRTDFDVIRERCTRNGSCCFYYTRTVDQVLEAYVDLGRKEKDLQNLRNLAVFPYRYTGVQALTLEPDGIHEYGERSMARHLYGDLESGVYTRAFLYLIKGDGEEIILPVECLDALE